MGMMHDCPKCGFHQPKDRYCAKCGVDIERFSAKPKPIMARIFENTRMQISLVVLVVITLIGFIYFSQRQMIESSIAKAISGLDSNLGEEYTEVDSNSNQEPLQPKSLQNIKALNTGSRFKKLTPDQDTDATSPNALPTKISFEFAEVPRAFLQELVTEGQVLNETQNTRSVFFTHEGSVRGLKRKDIEPYFLPGGTSSNISPDSPTRLEFLRFAKGYSSEIGLLMDVEVASVTEDVLEIDVQAILSLPSDESSVSSTEFQGKYKIGTNGVLAIAGLVPQQSIRGEAESALANTPIVIMSSPDFVAHSTEFIVFIRAE
jgi:hypothetical protein